MRSGSFLPGKGGKSHAVGMEDGKAVKELSKGPLESDNSNKGSQICFEFLNIQDTNCVRGRY